MISAAPHPPGGHEAGSSRSLGRCRTGNTGFFAVMKTSESTRKAGPTLMEGPSQAAWRTSGRFLHAAPSGHNGSDSVPRYANIRVASMPLRRPIIAFRDTHPAGICPGLHVIAGRTAVRPHPGECLDCYNQARSFRAPFQASRLRRRFRGIPGGASRIRDAEDPPPMARSTRLADAKHPASR